MLGLGFLLIYITGFVIIIIQSNCIGMGFQLYWNGIGPVNYNRPRNRINQYLRAQHCVPSNCNNLMLIIIIIVIVIIIIIIY